MENYIYLERSRLESIYILEGTFLSLQAYIKYCVETNETWNMQTLTTSHLNQ